MYYHRHAQFIKFHFLFTVLLICTLIGGSAIFLRPAFYGSTFHPYITPQYFVKIFEYVKYRQDFTSESLSEMSFRFVQSLYAAYAETPDAKSTTVEDTAITVPVLLYHGVIKKPDGSNILEQDFAAQMWALKRAGYETVTLRDFLAFMKEGKQLPAKSFVLTFDDGRTDSYYPVDPILKALGYEAVIFVITGHSIDGDTSGRFYLSLGELQQMQRTGRWEIEAHTHNGHDLVPVDERGTVKPYLAHKLWIPDLKRLETDDEYRARIRYDLTTAKERLYDKLNINSVGFAYPFGDFGNSTGMSSGEEQILLAEVAAVYPLSFYQVWSNDFYKQNYADKNAFLIKRIEVGHDVSGDELVDMLEDSAAKPLPYADTFLDDHGWRGEWGEFAVSQDELRVFADASTTGAMVMLDGGLQWKDYRANAEVSFPRGQIFGIIGAYRDNDNYLTCRLSENAMVLEERREGIRRELRVWHGRFPIFKTDQVPVGIEMSGNTASCLLNQRVILSADSFDPKDLHGGVGFMTWGPEIRGSEVTVERLFVEPISSITPL